MVLKIIAQLCLKYSYSKLSVLTHSCNKNTEKAEARRLKHWIKAILGYIVSSKLSWPNRARLLSTRQNKICSLYYPFIIEMNTIHQISEYLLGTNRKQALRKR